MNLNSCVPTDFLSAQLNIEMPKDVAFIIDTLYAHGYEAFAVGGCVRDALLGRIPHDWDITTSAKPEQVKKLFARTIDTGIQHGTVTIMIGREGYEVTTYRIDGEYEDARHPKEVIFTSNLIEDLKRRDFTINAMAYNDRVGVVDAFGGISDLEKKIIRCVGRPHDRFREDALRMMRAVRFAAQLGFSIDAETKEAVCDLAPTLARVSMERIHMEMIKLLTSDHPDQIRVAWELGLTAVFFPEFDRIMETKQQNIHHKYSVGEHTIASLLFVPADRELRFAMLFHDIGKPLAQTRDENGQDHFYGHPEKGAVLTETILKRWKLDNELIKTVSELVRWHDYRPELNEKSMRRSLNRIGTERIPMLLAVKRADVMAQSDYQKEEKIAYIDGFASLYQQVLDAKQCVQLKDMAIGGKDLIALGMRPGKQIGQVLSALFEMILDDPSMNDREKLLAYVREKHLACDVPGTR